MKHDTIAGISSGVTFSTSAAEQLVRDLPMLLAGTLDRIRFIDCEGREIEIGRFRIRSAWGEPIFYMGFTESRRAAITDSTCLRLMIAELTAGLAPEEERVARADKRAFRSRGNSQANKKGAPHADRPIPAENDPDVAFGPDATDQMVRDIPLLLAGLIIQFQIQAEDRRIVEFGRFDFLTLDGEPIFFIAFAALYPPRLCRGRDWLRRREICLIGSPPAKR